MWLALKITGIILLIGGILFILGACYVAGRAEKAARKMYEKQKKERQSIIKEKETDQ